MDSVCVRQRYGTMHVVAGDPPEATRGYRGISLKIPLAGFRSTDQARCHRPCHGCILGHVGVQYDVVGLGADSRGSVHWNWAMPAQTQFHTSEKQAKRTFCLSGIIRKSVLLQTKSDSAPPLLLGKLTTLNDSSLEDMQDECL